MLKFSIIIPVKELNSYLDESINHIINLEYEGELEIIILPNEKSNGIFLCHDYVNIIPTGKVSPATKRDIGVNNATGDIVVFLDDDSYPNKDFLSIANKVFETKDVDAINGPAITPPNATKRETMSGAFFESIFGGGIPHRCKDVGKSFYIDDAPSVNLLVKRKVFLDIGGFDSNYWPGEDSLFCQKLKDNGYKLWYQNNLIVYHHRRKTFKDHFKQVAGYGKHRGNFFRKNIGCSRKLTYLIPSIFLLVNIFLFIYYKNLWSLFLFIYFIIIFFDFLFNVRLKYFLIPLTVCLTFLSHLTYGVYFIIGFLTKDIKSKLR